MKAVRHLQRYLQGTKNRGIRYYGGKIQLRAAVDSSWADDVDSAESQFGWVVMLCGGDAKRLSELLTIEHRVEADLVFGGLSVVLS